ncbi:helix-turn-helix domain-containing protein [Xanthobacter sp. DSM 14520]|uniref:helix-turn-helix domain-containing protein n=1 Tax=Xanthobacter autotrophicus (strain ATCC BAA-1158 / Py2) TaxID=78245 RepID=UPI00372C4A0C
MTEKLFSVAEAAEYLGISEKTLRGHIMDGNITYILIGRGTVKKRRMFATEDLERFKESRRRREIPFTVVRRNCRRGTSSESEELIGFSARMAQLRAEKEHRRAEAEARRSTSKAKPSRVR